MGRSLKTTFVLLWAFGWLGTASAGEVKGKLFVTKVLTKRRVALPNYSLRGVPVSTVSDEPSSADEFSRVVVYLDGPPVPSESVVKAKLSQENTEFSPEILAVTVGATVSFPNEDPVFHNVFSLSKAKQFDLGYYSRGQSRAVKFDKVGVVQIYCHVHRDMTAAILVVPNSTYTHPEKDGTFVLSGVPAGKQRIVVWHKSAGFFSTNADVPENGAAEVSVTIPVPATE